jgi:predicted nucleotidyltransferase
VHFDFIPQKFGKTEKLLYICTVDNENGVLMTTQAIQETIAEYFKTQPVLKAWLFGSYARGEQREDSDVDILIVPDRTGRPFTLFTLGGMYMDLKELLGREVDLIEYGTLRPYAVDSAERDKKLIYERKSA